MNALPWTRLAVGTMQAMPDLTHHYWIMKISVGVVGGDPVVTYQALKLGASSWIHLGAHETFDGAKAIVATDWQLGLAND